MRDFLIKSAFPMIWVICALELVLLVYLILKSIKTKSRLTILVTAVTVGLFYDAFMIGLGGVIGEQAVKSSVFYGFSFVRFISHGLLIPLLIAICSEALHLKKPWNIVLYSVTGVLMVLGLAQAIASKFEVVKVESVVDIFRYAASKEGTPGWANGISQALSFGTVIPLIGVGIYCWIKQKNPHLCISGILMLLFSALGPATKNMDLIFYLSMYGEILMILFMVLYIRKQEKASK